MPLRHPLSLAVLLTACGAQTELTVVTYNAGLAVGFVDGAESRTPLVAQALAEHEADIICLQEIFLPEQVSAVETAAASAYPHQYFPDPLPPEPSEEVACDPDTGELDGLLSCIEDNCGDLCIDELEGCLFANCPVPFLSLSRSCQGCAMAQVGEDPQMAREVCENESTAYAYGHSFGTGILSRHPLRDVEHQVYDSSVNRRGAIGATAETTLGDVEVFCTHLTPRFSVLPYPRSEGSWIEEQRAQFEAMREWVDSSTSDLVVMMGDFNAGPELPGIDAEVPENYEFLAEGFENPYVDQVGECTLCGANPLRGTEDNRVIDHIFFRGGTDYLSRRILDHTITAESCDQEISVPLSDHYGVEVTFTP